MDIALCYENVLPARGGCETYIADLTRQLVRDGHTVHLYACQWDANALPDAVHYHRLEVPKGVRCLRPWRFGQAVEAALRQNRHDVTMGFDKTWGQDLLYPQGGLHVASAIHNQRKFPGRVSRTVATVAKWFDPAAWSFARLERKQYLTTPTPLIIVNSRMVQGHFAHHYHLGADRVRVVYSAIDPDRFVAPDRPLLRAQERASWDVADDDTVGLFVAMNYRLKGLAPLLNAVAHVPRDRQFTLAVVGHPKMGRYQRQADRLGIRDRVRFLGFRAQPKQSYFGADFLVHPTFYDPCSLVVLEALACGLPIITSQYNGASELLTPGVDGLVVADPHDAVTLGAAMTHMTTPARGEMAMAARRTAQRWTFAGHYQHLCSLFQEIAKRKQAA